MSPAVRLAPGLKIRTAFKEWAVVVDALGSGEQILVLRKGGIHEEGEGFKAEHREFFLLPTFEHQTEEDLVTAAKCRLLEIKTRAGLDKSSTPVQFFALLEEVFKVTDPEILHTLEGQHIWSEPAVEKKFLWGEEKLLHVMIVRVYRLPQAYPLRSADSYRGCKSWVRLEEDIPLAGAVPVLSDEEFQKNAAVIRGLLKKTS